MVVVSGLTYKHLLLPVYLASYRFRDKPYRVMVNGQTGHVLGDRPYSFGKILTLIGSILLFIAIMRHKFMQWRIEKPNGGG